MSVVERRRSEASFKPTELDLREFCRDQDKIDTRVILHWDLDKRAVWLRLAQIQLRSRENRHYPGVFILDSYFENKRDYEGDSAYIISFELISVEFVNISYGLTEVTAYINPNLAWDGSFHVPTVNYDPYLKSPVDYLPPDNRELYESVRGKRVTILTGTKAN